MGHIQSCMRSSHIHEEDTPLKSQCHRENRNDMYIPAPSSCGTDDHPRTSSSIGGIQSCPGTGGFAENTEKKKPRPVVVRDGESRGRTSSRQSMDGYNKSDTKANCPGEKRPKNDTKQKSRACFSHPFSGLAWSKSRSDGGTQKPYTTTVCPPNLYGNVQFRKENRVMMNKLPKQSGNVRHVKLPPNPNSHASDGPPRPRNKQKLVKSGLLQTLRKENGEDRSSIDIVRMGARAFSTEAILNSTEQPVELVCLDPTLQIYVCDIGLTPAQCQSIISIAEDCASEAGRYSAYTYAKQTLGCRDYDNLASSCAIPTHVACQSIRYHLGGNLDREQVEGADEAPTRPAQPSYTLVLDEREPHIVKYDTVEKTRQKLDMHTDKSVWTFLIALSEYGIEYEGGGTYFESSRTTYHLMRGQCLMFPGKLKHCGKKITKGRRFLLVGFMVKKDDVEFEECTLASDATASAGRNRVCEPGSDDDDKVGAVALTARSAKQ